MNSKAMANIYKMLSDENRLLIIKALYKTDEICACKFLGMVKCGQSTLSHHLSQLTESGIVSFRRDGQRLLYSCNKELLHDAMKYITEES